MLGKEESRVTGSVSSRARAPEQASVSPPLWEYLFPFGTTHTSGIERSYGSTSLASLVLWHLGTPACPGATPTSQAPATPCDVLIPLGPLWFWDPCPHPPREDLFLTAPDVCLAGVSWQVGCQLAETSGSTVSVECILRAPVRVSVRLAREAWVSSLLPVLTRGGRDVVQSFTRLSPVTDDIHSRPKCATPTEM